MPDEPETTLADLLVLDLSDGIAGAYCASLFAGYGADVILIEPPAGNPLRRHEAWSRLAAGKRSITLDIRTTTGRLLFRDIVEGANLIVECFAPGAMDALGLGFAELQAIKRRIILTSIQGSGDPLAECAAGLNAFAASAIAAQNADSHEIPQHIEIAAPECLASAVALRLHLPSGEGAYEGAPFQMSAVAWTDAPAPALGEHNAQFFCEEMGLRAADLPLLRAAGVI
ncbi:MAG: CoA transferase [Chloroflexota bacterium]|nr:CoA transferase [Chloroflexota bacterium]